ncbi:MAG: twin-arginine translocase TatA/TatE family subunit [Gemmatimonadetes bacterium]|nr:twin-arginine translocase TatA/TatE family subunit [Gemmatimonadota bacterium]MYI06700.1 twin-arginine translocase TatA/TatE family subunit [Gemmatimonadota bacterium]
MGIGIKEILFGLLIVVLILGAKRLPDIARGLGSGIRNFKGSLKDGAEGDSGQGEERHGS